MSVPTVVFDFNEASDRACQVRRIMVRSLRDHLRRCGPDLAGFALVTWDMRGACCVGHSCEHGPVACGLMPLFVQQAINRTLAVQLAQSTEVVPFGDGA